MAMFGVTPVVLWTVMRYAAMTVANRWAMSQDSHRPLFSTFGEESCSFSPSAHRFGDEMGLYVSCLPLQGGKAHETVLIQNSSPSRCETALVGRTPKRNHHTSLSYKLMLLHPATQRHTTIS